MEKKLKHLEMVQGVINRMANNSFMLKGWAVTLVAGIFALSGEATDKLYFLVAYIPIIVFWGLEFNSNRNCYYSCFFSGTELGFYLPLALVCAGIIYITQI